MINGNTLHCHHCLILIIFPPLRLCPLYLEGVARPGWTEWILVPPSSQDLRVLVTWNTNFRICGLHLFCLYRLVFGGFFQLNLTSLLKIHVSEQPFNSYFKLVKAQNVWRVHATSAVFSSSQTTIKKPNPQTELSLFLLFSFPLACKEAERDSIGVVIAWVHLTCILFQVELLFSLFVIPSKRLQFSPFQKNTWYCKNEFTLLFYDWGADKDQDTASWR